MDLIILRDQNDAGCVAIQAMNQECLLFPDDLDVTSEREIIRVSIPRLDQFRVRVPDAILLEGVTDEAAPLRRRSVHWERGHGGHFNVLWADTPAQAQALLNQIFRRIARVQGTAVEIRGTDIGTVQPSGSYSEIALNVNFDCRIEGLANLLTDIASQPEFLAWRDLRISSPDSKLKRINVTLTFVGLAPAKLLPAAQGANRG